jgi:CAAX protease family protein
MHDDAVLLNPEPPRLIQRIFFGPEGLRAGWRLLLYVIGVALLLWGSSTILRAIFGRAVITTLTPKIDIIRELFLLASAMVPAIVAWKLEKRPWGVYGLPLESRRAGQFATGLLVGFSALSLLLLLIHFFHGFELGSVQLSVPQLFKYAVLWGIGFVLVGVTEEFTFRGYSQFTLASGIGFWLAGILLSAGFGAVHLGNRGEDWVGALSAGAIAFVFVFSLWRTGSLWFAIGTHAAWDWAESFFYGVPDSGFKSVGTLFHPHFQGSKWITGGTVGPEGSLLVFVAVSFVALCIQLFYPKRQWPPEQDVLRTSDQHTSGEHQHSP